MWYLSARRRFQVNGFLGSAILEAAIGTALLYLLLAVFCSTVNEWIATVLDARASNLRVAIEELLNNQHLGGSRSFLDAFYDHPVISGLSRDRLHPTWMPSRSFSTAVIDLATGHVQGAISFADLETGIRNLPEGDVRTSLLALVQNTEKDLARAQKRIEEWFDDAMARASVWYKARTQLWTVVIASFVTVALNADTLTMVRHFWAEPALRAHPETLLGWTSAAVRVDVFAWLTRLIGWCLTVSAVSLGAPFWFDLLNHLTNFRGGSAGEGKSK
jgi:hypothetical protein